MRCEKWLQQRGVVVPSIVQDEDESAMGTAMAQQLAQEGVEGHRIELRGELGHKLAAAEMDRPEERHGFARRRMEQHGIRLLGRHPHDTARAMLLEVAFVETPEINPAGAGEPAEFF